MRRIPAISTLIALTSSAAPAQVPPPPSIFEVASIRPSQTGARDRSMEFSKGGQRFTATNMPFGALILMAYNVTVRQLSGPGEFLSEKYDIEAKTDHPVRPYEMVRMLQALLADRFKLVVRHETKDVPVYTLTVGKGGPKLHPSDPPESEAAVPRNPSHAGGTEPMCGHLIFKNESMPDFAWALSRMSGIGDRVVVDNTGLKGNYDFELRFERDRIPHAGADLAEPATRLGDPPIFSALQEQLGLKLESKKAPIEFLIIDHVEKPSGN